MLKFICPLIVVEEIARSRYFYEQLLGQKVRYDFGGDIQFVGDFSIHLKSHYQTLLGDVTQYPVTFRAHNAELYFETDELESTYQCLQQAQVEFIHAIQEQPWGTRVMRLYDPDGHILEIGESMEAAIWRFHGQGWSAERICERTGMPREFVEQTIRKYGEAGQASGE